jgi:hypothetical protein
MLEQIEASMVQVRNAGDELPAVICVAAQATLLLIDKYFTLTDDCELYQIAIGKSYYTSRYYSCADTPGSNLCKLCVPIGS